MPTNRYTPGAMVIVAVFALAVIASLGGLWGGPALGDHEAIVAECARGMRISGEWVVPQFLDTPFIRKPPLAYWLVAAASYLFPADQATGLPVTVTAARLPSALAGLGTILLVWRMGSMMFGRLAGILAALAASSSVFLLLYSPNATVEMILTFCCVWAVLHFWCAVNAPTGGKRFAHMMFFYVALGAGMLAKGPAPMALVAVPLAVWWFTWRMQRIFARGGIRSIRLGLLTGLRELPRLILKAFTQLWLLPGLIVFALLFIPWMMAVAERYDFAWRLWNWQYLQRFQGDYEDTRVRGVLYYVPVAIGLIAPWCFAIFEGLLAPWLPRYRAHRKALYFVGIWAVTGAVVMSLMEFKKPYYVLPILPGFILLMTPVLERVILRAGVLSKKLVRAGMFVVPLLVIGGGVIALTMAVGRQYPVAMVAILGVFCAGLLAVLHLAGRAKGVSAYGAFAVTVVVCFLVGWYAMGPGLGNLERAIAVDKQLDDAGVADEAPLYFADQRPDARLNFYFNRKPRHLLTPSEIVTRAVDRTGGANWLEQMAIDKAEETLSAPTPVYLLLDRENLAFLEQMPPQLQKRIRVVTAIDIDHESEGEDWVIVTNAAG